MRIQLRPPTDPNVAHGDSNASDYFDYVRRTNPDADATSVLLLRQVIKANRLLTQAVESNLEAAGLTWAKFRMLVELERNEIVGGGTGLLPSQLSELQEIQRNSVSTLIASVEAEGLICRELHPTDRRKFVIRLTPRGRKVVKSRLASQFKSVAHYFRTLSGPERELLLKLLVRLTTSLTRE